MPDESLARVAHDLADLFSIDGFVAVGLAVFARWLGILWTAIQPFEGIGQQRLTIGAQRAFGCVVFTTAVDVYELLQDIAVLLSLVHVGSFLTRIDFAQIHSQHHLKTQ